ncbi:uncharacterized protein LOC119662101 [Teleopsis dalmanni]|uniref:uncharacterized protein LOC119662101 n=1 Tax=Teleopsis dalmanni TaxID=139649 RepID=UPI0018CEE9A2|nr:uncharacterized protein LOC119662101 [Teleopsis dalmanni]XP_037927581.1 uncharacterized protein LOC119662101 [Teleopsis dalmanni]
MFCMKCGCELLQGCDYCGKFFPCFLQVDEQKPEINAYNVKPAPTMIIDMNNDQKAAVSKESSESMSTTSSVKTSDLIRALQTHEVHEPFKSDQGIKVENHETLFVDTRDEQKLSEGATPKARNIHGFNSKLFDNIDTTGFPRTVFASAPQLNKPKDLNSSSKQLEVNSNQASLTNPHATFVKPGLVKAIRDEIENGTVHKSKTVACGVDIYNSEKNHSICLTKSIQTQIYENEKAVSLHLSALNTCSCGHLLNCNQNVYKVLESTCTTTTVHLDKNVENINTVKREKKMPASLYEELTAAVKLRRTRQINKISPSECAFLLSNSKTSCSADGETKMLIGQGPVTDVEELPTTTTAHLEVTEHKIANIGCIASEGANVSRILESSFKTDGFSTIPPSAVQNKSVSTQTDFSLVEVYYLMILSHISEVTTALVLAHSGQ